MSYFSKLKKQLSTYLDKKQVAKIQEAYLLAEKAHEPQKRQSGEPYITHPVAVAITLAELELDSETIIAALLHDVIEDTSVGKNIISEQFGGSVAELVDGVSKLTQISFASKVEAQAENFRKMVLAMAKDLRVVLVKLADRLHNMRTLDCVSSEKRRRIARETLDIYTPLANRLGMHKLRVQLEDLCFTALNPNREKILSNAIKKIRKNRKEVIKVIEQAIFDTGKKHKFKQLNVQGREKHLYSIYKKMRDRRLSLNEIMDVYAFRIIVDNVEDCYRILGYVHNLYKPVPERFKDYIAIPKANGYQSLHTTLFGPYGMPLEIQIRTSLMHEMAENGIAAHWLYKEETPLANTEAQVRAQAWVKNLVEMQKSSTSSIEFVENVKTDLFPDEVYVFSPKGDILELPRGATPVDFAYAVHSDLGNTCVAAKVDRQYALLSSKLVNGQTVEIIRAPGARPNPAWLDFTVTGKARSTIRHYFKRQRSSESIELGRKLLDKALTALSLNLETLPQISIKKVLQDSKLESFDRLLELIGLGDYTARVIARRLNEVLDSQLEQQNKETSQSLEPISIHGTEGLMVSLAKCCHPIPGDTILGVLNSGKGILVHAEVCKKIIGTKENPENFVPLRWETNLEKSFVAKIYVEVDNSPGNLKEIAGIIAGMGSNIEGLYTHNIDESVNSMTLLISVKDRQHLHKILRRIQKFKSVNKVNRET